MDGMTYYNVCTVSDCPNREITAGGNCGGVRWDENGVVTYWGIVGEPGPKGVITNYDRIISKTPEELAKLIEKFASNTAWALYIHGEGGWLDWLKSPAKEETE